MEYVIVDTFHNDTLLVLIREPNCEVDRLELIKDIKAISPLHIHTVEYDYEMDSYSLFGVYEDKDITLTVSSYQLNSLSVCSTCSIWIEVTL